MARKKKNINEKNSGEKIRKEILGEINKYQYENSEETSLVKRFVKKEPVMGGRVAQSKILKNKSAADQVTSSEPLIIVASPQTKKIINNHQVSPLLSKTKIYRQLSFWAMVCLVGLVIVFIFSFYIYRLDRKYPGLASFLPWPVAYVNGDFLLIDDWHSDVKILRFFYTTINLVPNNDPTLTLSQLEQTAMNRLVKDTIIRRFAKNNNITVDEGRLTEEYASVASEFGGEESMLKYLNDNYGWGSKEFKNKILRPYLLKNQVYGWFINNQSVQIAAQDKINQIYNDIKSGSVSFADAALKYSEDSVSASQGGSLGQWSAGTMFPEFEYALRKLAVGEVSEPVKTSAGWHVIMRQAVSDEAEVDTLAGSHILIRIFDLDDWLNREIARGKIFVFLKD